MSQPFSIITIIHTISEWHGGTNKKQTHRKTDIQTNRLNWLEGSAGAVPLRHAKMTPDNPGCHAATHKGMRQIQMEATTSTTKACWSLTIL